MRNAARELSHTLRAKGHKVHVFTKRDSYSPVGTLWIYGPDVVGWYGEYFSGTTRTDAHYIGCEDNAVEYLAEHVKGLLA